MGGLSVAKADAVAALVGSLPDEALRTLKLGLSEPPGDMGLTPVRHAVEAELADRRLRDAVIPELRPSVGESRRLSIPSAACAVVWRALRAFDPAAVAHLQTLLDERETAEFAAASLDLVNEAVNAMVAGEPAFAAAFTELERDPQAAERVGRVLRLIPLVRSVAPRARAWLKQGGVEEASSLRLAIRDASALFSDGGPMLIDLLATQCSEPFAALRLVSAVMGRPSEAFLAGTEFAPFALEPLALAERVADDLRRAGSLTSREEGVALSAALTAALFGLEELEFAVQLDRERAWGQRVVTLRRTLATAAEARLKEADSRVAAALPVRKTRPGPRHVRGAPYLEEPLDLEALGRAEAVLAFVEGVRRAATRGGFGVLRARVIEGLDARLETYVEDLLDHLHADGGAAGDDLVQRLHAAADLWSLVRDPSAAQIVRRRMAAA